MAAALKPLLALSLIGWCAVCGPTYGAECRDETEAVEGTLRLVRTKHAMNSTPIEALQLVFNPPLCLTYRESVTAKDKQRLDGVKSLHLLVTAADAARLKRRVGAQVSAKARPDGGISPALTAWHIGDAIMVRPEIVTIDGKPFSLNLRPVFGREVGVK
jgi:hypothetical protein